MRIIRAKDYQDMSKKAAFILAGQVSVQPNSVLGLATGSTPIGTYQELISYYSEGILDFSQITTVNLDEYKGLPRTNEQSYYYFMNQQLFAHVNIDKAKTHIPNGEATDGAKECAAYEDLVLQLGGIDLQLLGIGNNGHIGFNEPDDVFTALTHEVALAADTIEANKRFFASADEVPKSAFTMGIATIMKAKKIVLLASGAGKAEILAKMLNEDVTPQIPATILQLHPDVTIIADEAALSKLGEK